jgi:hypothetical protein
MFVLLFENMPEKNHMDLIIKRFYDAMSVPFETKGEKIKIEVNIYVSTSESGENPKNVNIAGLSLTQAKKPEFGI